MSLAKDIAEEVVGHLNGLTLSVAFTAEYDPVPAYTVEELSDLRVTASPNDIEVVPDSRNTTLDSVQVAIGIQKKTDEAGVEDLDTLADEILESLRFTSFDDVGGSGLKAAFGGVVRRPYISWDRFRTERVFQAFVVVTYRTRR